MSDVKMLYRNWRGEVSRRSFTPVNMFHGTNEYHPVADWLIEGIDHYKNEVRTYSLKGFDMTNEISLRDAMIADRNALIAELVGALEESEEYFDQRSDADMDQDGYIPNEEMKLLTVVRSALTKAREQVK